MLHSPLDAVALAYEPVWDRSRRIAASRLRLHALHPPSIDIQHLLQVLTDGLPVDAPSLLLHVDSPALLVAMLKQAPVRNTWLEVPEFIWAKPEALELLLHARRYGHQLLWRGPLSHFEPYAKRFQGLRGVLDVSADNALQALRAAAQKGEFTLPAGVERLESPILGGHLYTGVSSRALADHALDKQQAWGVVGWPDDELLMASDRKPLTMDQRVMVQIMQAIEADVPMLAMERLLVQDPVLVYRILRWVNSAAFGLSHEVESVRHALMMLGYDKLKAWLRDGLPQASTDRSLHPLRHAMLMRSRLMRLLLDPNADEEIKGEVQLTGLFAQLDRLLKEPLPELLNQLPLPARIFSSLVRGDGPYVAYLAVAQAMADPLQPERIAAVCEQGGFSLQEANAAVIELLATAREPADQTFSAQRGPLER